MQKQLCISAFLLDPLGLPHNADTYAETTMLSVLLPDSLEPPRNADAHAEPSLRVCFSVISPETAPRRRRLCRKKRLCVPDFLLNPLELPHDTDIYAETTLRSRRYSARSPERTPQHRCLCGNVLAFLNQTENKTHPRLYTTC